MLGKPIATKPNIIKAATSKFVVSGWSSWLTETATAIACPEFDFESNPGRIAIGLVSENL